MWGLIAELSGAVNQSLLLLQVLRDEAISHMGFYDSDADFLTARIQLFGGDTVENNQHSTMVFVHPNMGKVCLGLLGFCLEGCMCSRHASSPMRIHTEGCVASPSRAPCPFLFFFVGYSIVEHPAPLVHMPADISTTLCQNMSCPAVPSGSIKVQHHRTLNFSLQLHVSVP